MDSNGIFTPARAKVTTAFLAEGQLADKFRSQRMLMLFELLVIAIQADSEDGQIAMAQDCLRRYGQTTPELEHQVLAAIARRSGGLRQCQ